MWLQRTLILMLMPILYLVCAQKRETIEKLNEILDIREEIRRFDIDHDLYFNGQRRAMTSIVRSGLSMTTGDVTIVLRLVTMINIARFDANAPYTGTALGITTKLPRRPYNEWTTRNKNIACLYAGYRVLLNIIPEETERIRQMMEDFGLNPDDVHEDNSTPIGIGNLCGNNVVRDRANDGANQYGDEGGVTYNRNPYSDYTDYQPVNTAYKVIDPSRWQPSITTEGMGKFFVQQFVTPHNGLVRPYTFKDVNQFEVGPHGRILNNEYDLVSYKATTDEVILESASLTEERKVKSEFFEDKAKSILSSVFHLANANRLGIDEFNQVELMSTMAMFDTMIIVWKEKRRWDAVRPFTAIKYLYGDNLLTAWGGKYQGIVSDIPAKEWTSYLPVANHPEYPSASTGACVSHAETQRLFYGSDLLNWDVTFEAGDSRIEPGAVPARNTTYHFKSLSQFETECGQSRLWAGVHFQDAIDSIKPIAREVAKLAFNFVKKHANAEKPVHPYPNPGPHSPGPHHPEPHHPGPLHSHDPLTINELPPNPFSKPFQSPAYPGYNNYHYPTAVTPAPVAPPLAPSPHHVPFQTPKGLDFSKHFKNTFSFSSAFGKKK